ncbi:MAG TPA: PepSY-associated TM helix domain-containing protein [Kofleriaceae bacterium]|nr:PepSY-associated TM helix domain-containing protein [Kofleriaceae bacterium]
MADPAQRAEKLRDSGLWPIIKKRWRAWLRAIHRDVGYLAIGFTVIYAISGIAQNHIEDWGDISYKSTETTVTLPAIPASTPDADAIAQVVAAAHLGTPTAKLRAGDEIRLEYANGAKATLIGTQLTVQSRSRRVFIGAANWLHTARQKKGWKYVADAFAVFLLYLAISGIFMIKGKLGLKGRGAVLISIGVAVPITAVLLSSPAPKAKVADADEPAIATMPVPPPTAAPAPPATAPAATPPTEEAGSAKKKCDPFSSMHACEPPAADQGSAEKIDTSGIKFLPPDTE